MEQKSNNCLTISNLKPDDLIPVSTSKQDYSELMITDIGTGIPLWKNSYAEKKEQNVLLLVPSEKYYLDAALPVSKQNEYIKKCLFDNYAIQVLFHKELDLLNKKLGDFTQSNNLSGDQFLSLQKKEMNVFYNRRRKVLCDLDSVYSLVEFIKQQLNDKDIQKVSSYLSWCGICGISFSGEEFDYLLFDPAAHSIRK